MVALFGPIRLGDKVIYNTLGGFIGRETPGERASRISRVRYREFQGREWPILAWTVYVGQFSEGQHNIVASLTRELGPALLERIAFRNSNIGFHSTGSRFWYRAVTITLMKRHLQFLVDVRE